MFVWAIIEALLSIIPAYLSSPGAVLTGGKLPIDFGRSWKGRRILGDGKTYRGFIGGSIIGIVGGMAINLFYPIFGSFPGALIPISGLAVGGLLGDMLGSFIKRRIGIGRGEKILGLDQYDLLIGAFLLTFLLDRDWFILQFNFYTIIIILVITPILHRLANLIAYKIGKKDVPW